MAVQEKFLEHGVVPDVIDQPPTERATVKYDSGVEVELGNELTPTQVQNAPTVSWPAEDGSFYTLIMTDPDAPSHQDPKYREWRHWLVFNIPGQDVSMGEEWWTYVGSGPPQGTGLHRYVFLVYKQPSGKITPTEPKKGNTGKGRNNTKAKDIVSEYGLGVPVAGNFYQAQWDDYVPKLYAKLH